MKKFLEPFRINSRKRERIRTYTQEMKNLTSLFKILIILLMGSFGSNAQTTVTDVFSVAGSYNWVAPCGIVGPVVVHVYGAGGGGAGSTDNNGFGGGAGGSGAHATMNLFPVPGQSYPLEVGAGGMGSGQPGNPPPHPINNGVNGAISWFNWNAPAAGNIFARGGQGGRSYVNGSAGGIGGADPATWGFAGSPGNPGTAGIVCVGGNGGSAPAPFGGGGGAGGGSAAPGGNGGPYGGGGGGGGCRSNGNNTLGGNGADGAVVLVYTIGYDLPDAGIDQNVCGVVSMTGNAPSPDWTGTWSVVSGSASIVDPNDPNSQVSVLVGGTCATLRWTFTHDFDPTCAPRFDDVVICFPLLCNDDPCGALPLTVNPGACSYTTYNNQFATASTTMIEPGCGDWSDNDAWYSAVVPASGVVTVNGHDYSGSPPGPTMIMGLAIYTGPNCNNLTHAGCNAATSGVDNAELTYVGTPGETIWIRAWDTSEDEGNYDLCAFEPNVLMGDVMAGPNTVTCGSTMQFIDPGGTGSNYQPNTTAIYEICPSVAGQYVTADFTTGSLFFQLENGYDYLTVLDGATDSSYIIGQYTGVNNPGIITSSAPDGCLTFVFQSDNSVQNLGWEAQISCSAVAGVNDSTCTATDCPGECGTWICATGLYPTENIGNNAEDMSIGLGGCFDNVGEVASQWFYFTALTSGSVEFSFAGPGGQDYNFAVYGPSTNGDPPCPQTTGLPPVACSQADVGNYLIGGLTGMSSALGGGEGYEGVEGDGWIDALPVVAGETYAMLVNIYQNGGPQPVIDMTIGGTGTLDCLPVYLPIELLSFTGINQGDKNYITWVTSAEVNNDYFTLERSVNGYEWEEVGTQKGAGTSQRPKYYSMYDEKPYFPVTYYRLKQTDFDGEYKYFDVISVSTDKVFEGDLVSVLFPNPAESYVTFTYLGKGNEGPMTVRMINSFGSVAFEKVYDAPYNGQPISIWTDELAAGVYQVEISQGNNREIKKLSVIH